MASKPSSGIVLYGASLFAGAIALAELVLIFLPKVRPLGNLLELLELYLGKINPEFKVMIGDGIVAQSVLAAVLAWLASYAAFEAFSRKTDGLSLWRNIAHDSCGRVPQGARKTACTASKWLATLAGGPLIVLWAMLARLQTGAKSVTVGFITVAPGVLLKYIKHLLIGLAVAVSAAFALSGRAPPQHAGLRYPLESASTRGGQVVDDRRAHRLEQDFKPTL